MALLATSCGHKDARDENALPPEFATMGDSGRVRYMMDRVSPDSVARFICNATLGKIPPARIDTFANATLYAYENYKDSALTVFSEAMDNYMTELPLPDKMRMLAIAGTTDPQGLGYELGLEYANNIRDNTKTLPEVEKEIEALRDACGSDTVTFQRFMIGFKTVLRIDSGRGLPAGIVERYMK